MANAPVPTVSGPSTGLRIAGIHVIPTSGDHEAMVWRGFGGPTGSYSSTTTSKHAHLAVVDTVDDDWSATVVSVTTTASRVDNQPSSTVLTYRKRLTFKNVGAVDVYIGKTSSVTTSGANIGLRIPPGASLELRFGARMTVYAIVASGTCDLEVMQEA